MRLNLILTYEKCWIAKCNNFIVKADNLDELDKKIVEELRKRGYRGEIELYMSFDMHDIPEWMRQYHPHYFCRIVRIKI